MTNADHAPLPHDVADQLLQQLSTNDAFREAFANDARAALTSLGYTPPAGATPYCLTVEKLASKEEFAQARGQLMEHLTSAVGLTVIFCYEAGRINEAVGS
ncbi:hypothetical protein ARC78_02870 [Stenotrophomonas pictorum JCM 9942]|jgi:putative modified peptide|uniref:Uncharacterized protein n=1 Tax=Stenotrophomonas pictorum JCM 9942 TaxID=1236960 RepID=A0A0R0AT33_9GAMM|nr:NHLP-related RiPP peptide [Stenotrophomonas pictorum]KRG45146.1 hypothetical protein ARC78_02870 [Stenotrophomonas pictorum JCM 9942]